MEIVNFIVDYWTYISFVLVILLEIISIFIKKRSKTEIIDSSAYREITYLIIQAESEFGSGHGEEKLNFVIDNYIKNKGLSSVSNYLRAAIKSLVETIMTTPQKKGALNEKVKKENVEKVI